MAGKPRVIDLTSAVPAADTVAAIRQHLDQGGLLAHPTETVYGIGSLATTAGVESLARLKTRGPDKPFLLLVDGVAMLMDIGLVVTPEARIVIDRYWPGPVTLILPGLGAAVAERLIGPGGGIAVRHTSHLGAADLVGELAVPITSTSANPPGRPPAGTIAAVQAYFPDQVASGELLLLDGGPLPTQQASTIVDFLGDPPRIVREGRVTRSELEQLLGSRLG